MTTVRAGEGIEEKYAYDFMGNITEAADGEGRRRQYHSDINGRTDCITYADGSREHFTYDGMGRLKSETLRSGKEHRYSYDVFGNPASAEAGYTVDGKPVTEKYTYSYDKDGNLAEALGGGIRYRYEYDECGRLKSKTASGRTLIKYAYDPDGNAISATDVTGKTTYYDYDTAGRLAAIMDSDRVLAEYSYTEGGRIKQAVCGGITTQYEYDGDGRTAGIKVTIDGETISGMNMTAGDTALGKPVRHRAGRMKKGTGMTVQGGFPGWLGRTGRSCTGMTVRATGQAGLRTVYRRKVTAIIT